MGKYSIAEAEGHLETLIAEAERGEEVTITRDGRDIVRMNLLKWPPPPEPKTQAMSDWFQRHPPVGTAGAEDAGTFVSRMRDEEWTR